MGILQPGLYGPTGHRGEEGLPGYISGFVKTANFVLKRLGFVIINGRLTMWGPRSCFLSRYGRSYPPITPSSLPQPK